MTKKDFVIIAETINAEINDLEEARSLTRDQVWHEFDVWHAKKQGVINIAFRFAGTLASTNARFDRKRFLRAALGEDLATELEV